MRRLSEFLIGLIFGLGLMISGMTDPSKVKGFLDIAGNWDPSLAFVMGGAVIVSLAAFRLAAKRRESLFGRVIMLNDTKPIDVKLIAGSVILGSDGGFPASVRVPRLFPWAMGNGKRQFLLLRWLAAWCWLDM